MFRSERRRRRRKSHSNSLGNSIDADESSQSSVSGIPPSSGKTLSSSSDPQKPVSADLSASTSATVAGSSPPPAANGHLAAHSSSDESVVTPGDGPTPKDEEGVQGTSAAAPSQADRRKMVNGHVFLSSLI